MKENSKGAITEVFFLILLATFEPRHGYGIIQFISNQTEGRLTLGAGTLYGALNNLVDRGWISLVNPPDGARKKDYIITEQGRMEVASEISRYHALYQLGLEIANKS